MLCCGYSPLPAVAAASRLMSKRACGWSYDIRIREPTTDSLQLPLFLTLQPVISTIWYIFQPKTTKPTVKELKYAIFGAKIWLCHKNSLSLPRN